MTGTEVKLGLQRPEPAQLVTRPPRGWSHVLVVVVVVVLPQSGTDTRPCHVPAAASRVRLQTRLELSRHQVRSSGNVCNVSVLGLISSSALRCSFLRTVSGGRVKTRLLFSLPLPDLILFARKGRPAAKAGAAGKPRRLPSSGGVAPSFVLPQASVDRLQLLWPDLGPKGCVAMTAERAKKNESPLEPEVPRWRSCAELDSGGGWGS